MKVKEPWKICSRLKKTKGTCQLNVNLIHGHNLLRQKKQRGGFPGGAVVENLPANAGDTGSSPALGRSHMPQSN